MSKNNWFDLSVKAIKKVVSASPSKPYGWREMDTEIFDVEPWYSVIDYELESLPEQDEFWHGIKESDIVKLLFNFAKHYLPPLKDRSTFTDATLLEKYGDCVYLDTVHNATRVDANLFLSLYIANNPDIAQDWISRFVYSITTPAKSRV